MLQPLFCNSAQLDTFRYENQNYVMMTLFFNPPEKKKGAPESWRPDIKFMPLATVIMPRKTFKDIHFKFTRFLARQGESLSTEEKKQDGDFKEGPDGEITI